MSRHALVVSCGLVTACGSVVCVILNGFVLVILFNCTCAYCAWLLALGPEPKWLERRITSDLSLYIIYFCRSRLCICTFCSRPDFGRMLRRIRFAIPPRYRVKLLARTFEVFCMATPSFVIGG